MIFVKYLLNKRRDLFVTLKIISWRYIIRFDDNRVKIHDCKHSFLTVFDFYLIRHTQADDVHICQCVWNTADKKSHQKKMTCKLTQNQRKVFVWLFQIIFIVPSGVGFPFIQKYLNLKSKSLKFSISSVFLSKWLCSMCSVASTCVLTVSIHSIHCKENVTAMDTFEFELTEALFIHCGTHRT